MIFFFFFPFAVLPSGFFEFPNGKITKNCMSSSRLRGPTLELDFSSAIGWNRARVALPLVQTTSGAEGMHFVSSHVK